MQELFELRTDIQSVQGLDSIPEGSLDLQHFPSLPPLPWGAAVQTKMSLALAFFVDFPQFRHRKKEATGGPLWEGPTGHLCGLTELIMRSVDLNLPVPEKDNYADNLSA